MVFLPISSSLVPSFTRPEPWDTLRAKVCSAVVLSSSFYLSQLVAQRIFMTFKIHSGLPKLIISSIGLVTTVSSLCLSQVVEYGLRVETDNFGTGLPSHQRRLPWPFSNQRPSKAFIQDHLTRLALGLGMFVVLEQSLFRTVFPSSLIRTGVYANAFNYRRMSIPSLSEVVSEAQRKKIQALGRRFGCHHCGDRQWFKRGSVFIGDHMPPTKFAKEMSEKAWRRFLKMPVRIIV